MTRMLLLRKTLLFLLLLGAADITSRAAFDLPTLGAEVWVEPGNTRPQIDAWMETLADNRMPLARVFVRWRDLEVTKGHWDFGLYDEVFASAQQHGVGILATLTPHYPADSAKVEAANAEYIARVVEQYKTNPALDSWLLVNEPGRGPGTNKPALTGFYAWLKKKYGTIENLNRAWAPADVRFHAFDEIQPDAEAASWNPANWSDWMAYGRSYQAQQLENLADAVLAHDRLHKLHVNPHALMSNLAGMSDDLPAWRPFLSTLGASLHPAWHFGVLQSRDQFPLGVAYVCDMIRGASEPHPFWVTELQGGNNIYSGTRPLYPDGNDIRQWLWLSLGSGADRAIFWLLNSRYSGKEAGEWSMLDFQGRPSERLLAAAGVAKILEDNRDFFAGAKPVESSIAIILSLETMTLQLHYGETNAHLMETLGMYETLQDLGIPVRVKHINDYAWRSAGSNQAVILPHVSAMTGAQAENITAFVAAGNRALVTGLSGFYDPLSRVWPLGSFPLQDILGGDFKEVRYLNSPEIIFQNPQLRLPAGHLVGDIENISGTELAASGTRTLAISKTTGNGSTVWIPSLIGTGAWLTDRAPLAALLADTFKQEIDVVPFRFAHSCPGLVLRTLAHDNKFVTIIANGSDTIRSCRLIVPTGYAPKFLVGGQQELVQSEGMIPGHETLVIKWELKQPHQTP